MLFALVPLNQLSSDFTRIDGTVFNGTPCEYLACRALLACSEGPSTSSRPAQHANLAEPSALQLAAGVRDRVCRCRAWAGAPS
jgi:hypothetical protein